MITMEINPHPVKDLHGFCIKNWEKNLLSNHTVWAEICHIVLQDIQFYTAKHRRLLTPSNIGNNIIYFYHHLKLTLIFFISVWYNGHIIISEIQFILCLCMYTTPENRRNDSRCIDFLSFTIKSDIFAILWMLNFEAIYKLTLILLNLNLNRIIHLQFFNFPLSFLGISSWELEVVQSTVTARFAGWPGS